MVIEDWYLRLDVYRKVYSCIYVYIKIGKILKCVLNVCRYLFWCGLEIYKFRIYKIWMKNLMVKDKYSIKYDLVLLGEKS